MSLLLQLNPSLVELVVAHLSVVDQVSLFRTCHTLHIWSQRFIQRQVQRYYSNTEVNVHNYLFYRYSVEIMYSLGGSYFEGQKDWMYFLQSKDEIVDFFDESTETSFVLPITPLTLRRHQDSDIYWVREIKVTHRYRFDDDEETETYVYEIVLYPGCGVWMPSFIKEKFPQSEISPLRINFCGEMIEGAYTFCIADEDFPLLYEELSRRGYIAMMSNYIRDLNIIPEDWKQLPCFSVIEKTK